MTIDLVERYKTSGLSGDEWRFNFWVRCWFKGEVVSQFTPLKMQHAIMLLGSWFLEETCPLPERVVQLDNMLCDQPGCMNVPIGRFVLKRLTSQGGDYLDPAEQFSAYFRKFCAKHVQRGTCSREDSDSNYIPIDNATADDSTNAEESPSAFGGVIEIDEETLKRD